jgi:alpha-glucosidase
MSQRPPLIPVGAAPARPAPTSPEAHLWWQHGIIYQIYPRSFQDASGDGVGDLPGIMSRLDYLVSLGVDALWLSPVFPSPMKDFGYDVADYEGIDPLFGTLGDFDELLAQTHARGLKLMLDWVPNHTSDQHPWFLESRTSRDHPKRDWYVWRDPAPKGDPPNNWRSFFGGRAWTLDPATGQSYLHQFMAEQPELNWANPEVRGALLNAMRFWLERGLDGFRVDVIWLLGKHAEFPDEPENPAWQPGMFEHQRLLHPYTQHQPETHAYIREMRAVLEEYSSPGHERMMVGEVYLPPEDLMTYYGHGDECHLPFNFGLLFVPWTAEAVGALVDRYDALCRAQGGWPNWVLGNHDQKRFKTRVGAAQARVAQTLLLTLRGTPTVYYGDELGLECVHIPESRIQDPQALGQPELPGASRDPSRTPMPWNAALHAGFSTAEPWLPLHSNYRQVNVAVQEDDSSSELHYFRKLTGLRRKLPALHAGTYRAVTVTAEVFAYVREWQEQRVLVLLNFSAAEHLLSLDDLARGAQVLLSSQDAPHAPVSLARLLLRPNEALLMELVP